MLSLGKSSELARFARRVAGPRRWLVSRAPELMPKPAVLQLYRRILKAAAKFPSIKRKAIIEDIKIEFRERRLEVNPEKVAEYQQVGRRSYQQLLLYSGLNEDDSEWSLTTVHEPMPQ
mmetsp:Transcript_65568/g.147959  ORF Transcript_65568/g.147959 Transcript_65568/m.147959 type:complete len:118 (-) Transcript_65568:365-718(-)|eukprot:CAMPEP_0172636514 /NCGR_PEP_ID=MMETSP1068-20121228/204319_1 /TAXON_ID=35684 /ORGANISM="Pseudopedinella elastica, Strain CCMP716" /LENGTH=117 /DNA_ID=CAMNT_0013448949 /DNA_START=79 /DNA_END=432 /DNA_ORIENTATION=-